jgi:hypothetical protein
MAVALVLNDVTQQLMPRKEATEWLFARLVTSRSREESPFYEALLLTSEPGELLDVALRQYREQGYELRLSLVASLLGDMGRRSWTALRTVAERTGPETEYFVPVIASLEAVSQAERRTALAKLARCCDVDVLWSILNVVQDHPELRSPEILRAFIESRDEQLREEAEGLLGTLKDG